MGHFFPGAVSTPIGLVVLDGRSTVASSEDGRALHVEAVLET